MPLVLARVDDRLIHGQVVEGWLRVVQAERIVVVSDAVANDACQICLLRMAVPPEVKVTVASVSDVAQKLKSGEWEKERVFLLFPGLAEARRLVEGGVTLECLNLGGLRDAPGRTLMAPSLSLNESDKQDIRALLAKGVSIETRALPNDERRPAQFFLDKN